MDCVIDCVIAYVIDCVIDWPRGMRQATLAARRLVLHCTAPIAGRRHSTPLPSRMPIARRWGS